MTTAPPRMSRRAAAAVVAVSLAVAGALAGVLWAWLAPPAHGVIALTKSGTRAHAYLGAEADHFFVAAFLMVGILAVVAVVAAVAAWQWRAHRGPLMVAALAVGAMLGAGAAAGIGAVLVRARYGEVDIDAAPVTPQQRVHYFTEAPSVLFGHSPLQIAATVLMPAAAAALVYALIAVSTPRDDLGAYPPVDVLVPPRPAVDAGLPPVTADDGSAPAR